jgi:hypothetical protein
MPLVAEGLLEKKRPLSRWLLAVVPVLLLGLSLAAPVFGWEARVGTFYLGATTDAAGIRGPEQVPPGVSYQRFSLYSAPDGLTVFLRLGDWLWYCGG